MDFKIFFENGFAKLEKKKKKRFFFSFGFRPDPDKGQPTAAGLATA
jgi:hypothetical protein